MADTHDKLPPFLLEAIAPADEIWHLGDVCEKSILETIRKIGPPVQVVRGNQDSKEAWPMSLELERLGHRFHLVHIPPSSAPTGVKFLLHGHTHVPRDQIVDGARFLNPGPAGLANKGAPRSFAWLELAEGMEPVFRLVAIR
ncbi:MAG: metallophosphoesterase family protein [Verrucomicrobia bacterium]|nr:metallophosphoesterase family protein [Verrucomicrobiota bacterium]